MNYELIYQGRRVAASKKLKKKGMSQSVSCFMLFSLYRLIIIIVELLTILMLFTDIRAERFVRNVVFTGASFLPTIEYLTIIPRARMGYWLRGYEGERNNCFSKIQLVGQTKFED